MRSSLAVSLLVLLVCGACTAAADAKAAHVVAIKHHDDGTAVTSMPDHSLLDLGTAVPWSMGGDGTPLRGIRFYIEGGLLVGIQTAFTSSAIPAAWGAVRGKSTLDMQEHLIAVGDAIQKLQGRMSTTSPTRTLWFGLYLYSGRLLSHSGNTLTGNFYEHVVNGYMAIGFGGQEYPGEYIFWSTGYWHQSTYNASPCSNPAVCDSATSTCVASGTSYICQCKSGFKAATTTSCVDVNECATFNGGCNVNADCINAAGSYSCKCRAGFEGTSCSDVNECTVNNGGCDPASTYCFNTAGSRLCKCKDGFAMAESDNEANSVSLKCFDIDECRQSNGGCGADSTCKNTAGSRVCVCNRGFAGDGFVCERLVCVSEPALAAMAAAHDIEETHVIALKATAELYTGPFQAYFAPTLNA